MAKQSLAAEKGALEIPGGFQLPAVFQQPPEDVRGRFVAPYVVFAHSKRADEFRRIQSAFRNVVEGEMYLVEQDAVTYLPEMKCGWLTHKQLWVQKNAAGDVQSVSLEERPKPFKEVVLAVVFVYLEDRIVPANVEFRSTKCPAAKTMSDALRKAATVDWGEEGPAHKETLVISQPFCRFYGVISLGPPRTSKETGMPYRPANCRVEPTTSVEWRAMDKFQKDAGCVKALNDAANRFQFRVNELLAKVPK